MGKISYDDKLRKGPMSTKLARPHSTHSTTMCGVCDVSSIAQTSVKAKDHPRAKKCTAQICDDLPQTTINKAIDVLRKRLNACVSADGGHFEYMV